MSLNTGKRFIFLSLLSLWTVYPPTVSAQNKKREQISAAEPQSKTLETEVDTDLEKSRIDKTTDVPTAPQTDDGGEKNILENKGDAEIVEEKSERSSANRQTEINDFTRHFGLTGGRERRIDFKDSVSVDANGFSFHSPTANARSLDDAKNAPSPDDDADKKTGGFRWRSAIGQSLMFLAVQHGYAFTQPKTRESLKGKFFKDYAGSVKSLHGWDDGGKFFTNYIAHPMQGSLTGFIYVQNDPKATKQQFGASGDYWRSRMKAMAWTAAWSTQFEIGPVSQASIGNVGLKDKQTWEDIVVTPTLGTAMLVAEDAVDRFITRRIERKTDNFYVKVFSRMLLSPTRVFANMLRFKEPWYRDRPREH
ncbi:MAG TPA: hypothetical protein VNI84_06070 [Pyrinomonadaceae bacterium]|nr:hypothetical protein [Pyrinomonadaceae bacterium]